MDPRESTVKLIQEIITEWGLKEEECKDANTEWTWRFTQGSAPFHIQLFSFDKGEIGVRDAIEIGSAFMEIPKDKQKKEELYQYVLEMNTTSCGVWFGVRGEFLMLLTSRELEGLDRVEFRTLVDDIRYYADYFDDTFKEKYGSNVRKPGGL